MREACEKELKELYNHKAKGNIAFLKFIAANYKSYIPNKEIKFSEDDLKQQNLKKTMNKTCIHFHPDKISIARGNGFNDE